jgi:hypothetical protein
MILKMLACCLGLSKRESHIEEVLQPDSVSILSASCCDPSSAPKDEELKRNVNAAMEKLNQCEPVCFETITGAQAGIRGLSGKLDTKQQRLVDTVIQLFQTQGMSVFPMLIVDGRIAYYGGVPTVGMISEKLRARAAKAAQPAAQSHE